jgi:hypothetical protein
MDQEAFDNAATRVFVVPGGWQAEDTLARGATVRTIVPPEEELNAGRPSRPTSRAGRATSLLVGVVLGASGLFAVGIRSTDQSVRALDGARTWLSRTTGSVQRSLGHEGEAAVADASARPEATLPAMMLVLPPVPTPSALATGAATPAPASAKPARRASAAKAKGQLTVICLPACDDVFDGKTRLGPSPVFRVSTVVGVHNLRLVSGSVTRTAQVTVVEEDTAVVRESFEE